MPCSTNAWRAMTDDSLTIRPGVAGVVVGDEGNILLHRGSVGDGWAPPSGAVEPGEDLHAALRRELREETRLEVEIGRLVGVYSDPQFQVVRYPDGSSVHFVTSLFTCQVQAGPLAGSDGGTAWAWFAPGSFPEPLLPYADRWLQDALAEPPHAVVR